MIDIQSKIVDTIYNAVISSYPGADISTGFVEQTAIFPCVVVEEIENTPVRRTDTEDCAENFTRLTYEVSVYTDDKDHAKTEGKRIISIVDDALQALKFRRIRMNKPLNISRTIFRQYGRWEVIVGKPIVDGNDLIYQFYRR
jgi:hypothetical protein